MCHVKSSAVNIGAVEDALYPHLISWKSFYDTLRRVALDTHVRSLRIERYPVDLDRSLRFNGDRYIAERQTACGWERISWTGNFTMLRGKQRRGQLPLILSARMRDPQRAALVLPVRRSIIFYERLLS